MVGPKSRTGPRLKGAVIGMLNEPRARRQAEAVRFLAALYGGAPGGHLVLWVPGPRVALWPVDLKALAAEAVSRAAREDVVFGVAPRRRVSERGYGTARDIASLPAVWADLTLLGTSGRPHDLPPHRAATRALLADFPLAPSALVATGRGHQVYWFLDEPFDNADVTVTRAFLGTVGGVLAASAYRHGWRIDEHVFTAHRTMRLPGTLDHRGPRPRLVRLEQLHPERRYPVAALRMAAAVTNGAVAR